MTKAIGRLLFITLTCCFFIFTLLILLRQVAPTFIVPPLNSPLLQESFYLIADPIYSDNGEPLDTPRLPPAVIDQPHSFVALSLWVTKDNKWVVTNLEPKSNLNQVSFQIEHSSLQDLLSPPEDEAKKNMDSNLDQTASPLKGQIPKVKLPPVFELGALLDVLSHKRYFFIIHTVHAPAIPRLVEILNQLGLDKSVFFHSPNSKVLKQLRKHQPRWIYGLSPLTLGQAKLFTSLWLEGFAPLDSDFIYLSDPKELRHQRFIEEIHRRKRILIVKIHHASTLNEHSRLSGAYANSSEVFESVLESHQEKIGPNSTSEK